MTDARDWAGSVGETWAAEWRHTDLSFSGLAPTLNTAIAAAAPAGAGRALDIGCGAGATSLALADARPDLAITGVDLSAELVAAAKARAGERTNLSFVVGDACAEVDGQAPVDLFLSRHGVMFFDDPVAAFTRLRAAAAPDGRLVFSCFRTSAENGWAFELAQAIGGDAAPAGDNAPGPFAFADPDHVRAILATAGWRDAQPQPVDYLYHAARGGDPIGDAVAFFRRIGPAARALRELPAAARAGAIERLTAVVARHRMGDAIDFPAAAWIWSARG